MTEYTKGQESYFSTHPPLPARVCRSLVELCTALQAGLCVGVGNAGIAGGLQALSHGATSTQVPLSIEHPSSSPDTN